MTGPICAAARPRRCSAAARSRRSAQPSSASSSRPSAAWAWPASHAASAADSRRRARASPSSGVRRAARSNALAAPRTRPGPGRAPPPVPVRARPLVRPERRGSQMPGVTVLVVPPPEDPGQGAMGGAPLVRGRGVIERRTDQRMPELQLRAVDRDEAGPLGLLQRAGIDAERRRGPRDRAQLTGSDRRGQYQRAARFPRQVAGPAQERPLDAGGDRSEPSSRSALRSGAPAASSTSASALPPVVRTSRSTVSGGTAACAWRAAARPQPRGPARRGRPRAGLPLRWREPHRSGARG